MPPTSPPASTREIAFALKSALAASAAAADTLHEKRSRKGRERPADHPCGDGERRQSLVRGERVARQPIEGNRRRVVREQQRLASGEDGDVFFGGFHGARRGDRKLSGKKRVFDYSEAIPRPGYCFSRGRKNRL